jgi:predicted lipid carrier protein YhbT
MSAPEGMEWVSDFFANHLGGRKHQRLLPGLESLSTSFSLTVRGAGTFSVEIREGVLTVADPTDRISPRCHLSVEREDFARVVAAAATPQSLFVRRRLQIRGNPWHALIAASAMEEFFRRFPYPGEGRG